MNLTRIRSILLVFTLLPLVSTAVAGERPNIVLIYADDLGYGDVQAYNPESQIPTPHMNRLAEEGLRLTNGHSSSTVCTPSRYALLTGRFPFRTGFHGIFKGVEGPCLIEEERLTLPEMLREVGYETAMFGKWHLGATFFDRDGKPVHETSDAKGLELVSLADLSRGLTGGPLSHGFNHFFGAIGCPTTDYLYSYIDGNQLTALPNDLRDRSKWPQNAWTRDFRIGMVSPDFDLEEVDMVFLEKSLDFLEAHQQTKPDEPFFLFHSTQTPHLPSFPSKSMQGKTDYGPHGDFLYQFDWTVGQLLQKLDELGLTDDTLVIVTSDNGPEVTAVREMIEQYGHDGAHPWRGLKRDNWEGGHRVPFIIKWPGTIEAGRVSDQAISQTDLMHTIAAITDFELPDDAAEDSFNMLPLLLTEPSEPLRPFLVHHTFGPAFGIHQGPWKYLDHQGSGGNDYDREKLAFARVDGTDRDAPGQLYNLENDPKEMNNLYHQHPDEVQALKEQLHEVIYSGRSR